MAGRLTSWFMRPGRLWGLVTDARLAVRLFREPRVPAYVKALPVLAVLYVLSPFDVIPDVLPVVGQIDDLGVLILTVKAFLKLCPSPCASFHAAEITQRRPYAPMPPAEVVIDAQFRRE